MIILVIHMNSVLILSSKMIMENALFYVMWEHILMLKLALPVQKVVVKSVQEPLGKYVDYVQTPTS